MAGSAAMLGGTTRPTAASGPNVGAVLGDIMKAAQPQAAASGRGYYVDASGKEIKGGGPLPKNARHVVEGLTPGYPIGGAGAAAGPAAGAPGTYTNTAQKNPTVSKAIDLTQNRIAGDLGAKRAIDVTNGQIREDRLGGKRELDLDEARRGVTGTGVDKALGSRYGATTEALMAKNAANITADRETHRDDLIQSLGSLGSTEAQIGQADKRIALDQQQAIDQSLAQQQAARDRQMEFLVSSLLSFNPGGY